MRREQTAPDNWVKWLKSKGCVFYAPMDAEHGTTDLISGQAGSVPSGNTNCTVTYDTSLKMHVIDNNCANYAGLWWTGLDMFPDAVHNQTLMRAIEISMFATIRIVTNPAGNHYNIAFGQGGGTNGLTDNVTTGNSGRKLGNYVSPYVSPFNLRAGVTATVGVMRKNATNYTYMKNYATIQENNNETWTQKYYDIFGQRFSIAAIAPNNGARTHYAFKNIYVFNRGLTDDETAVIAGHDNM